VYSCNGSSTVDLNGALLNERKNRFSSGLHYGEGDERSLAEAGEEVKDTVFAPLRRE
jgi:hypothetical protein